MAIATVQIVVSYTENGLPLASLSPVIKIREVGTGLVVIASDPMTNIGDGFYRYDFTTFDTDKSYVYVADGGVALADELRFSYGGNDNFIKETAEAVAEQLSVMPFASFS